jgi:hypothetical protein
MPVLVKKIKPRRLQDKAMRLVLLNAMRKAGTVIKKDFEKTTKTWSNKPKFEALVSLKPPGPTLLVGTNDEVYRFVDEGTEEHFIFPVNKKALAFPGGPYTAKTKPGVIDSFAGGPSGETKVRAWTWHPGTAPREFDKTIKKAREPWFKRQMEIAMREAARVSGHQIT